MIRINEGYSEIELPEKSKEVAAQFAKKVIDSNLEEYERRGQSNFSKILDQIIQGKIAEIAVAKFYSSIGFPVSMPDFKVYPKGGKSFDSDLDMRYDSQNYFLHIKSISSSASSTFGLSWIFQRSDPLYFAPASTNFTNHRIGLTEVVNSNLVRYFGLVTPQILASNSEELKIETLRKTKVALYHEGVSEHLTFLP